jgi:uncharacterized protein YceH (UPF0502 family)
MSKFNSIPPLKTGVCLVALILMIWAGWTTVVGAQVNQLQLESRVDRLESELSRVRSRLTQLEAHVAGPNRITPPASAPVDGVDQALSLEDQFDNLATLAIELKQDLRQLEARVTALEQAVSSR